MSLRGQAKRVEMLAKRIIGIVFLAAFVFSLGYKLLDSLSDLDGSLIFLFVFIIGFFIFLGIRQIFRA